MTLLTVQGLLVPFFGTALGAACVLFMKKYFSIAVQNGLMGFAAGVMVAASVWSLLIPSIDQSQHLGKLAFIPAVTGFCIGMISLMLTDKITDKIQKNTQNENNSYFRKTTMLVIAVVLHNIPEGMAVGAVYANALATKESAAFSAAFVLAMGIAIQNLPEGAIISMPLAARGMSKGKAFFNGIMSGVVEPVAGFPRNKYGETLGQRNNDVYIRLLAYDGVRCRFGVKNYVVYFSITVSRFCSVYFDFS